MTILDTYPVIATEVAEFIDVTPDLAQRWLGRNTANRRIKQQNVIAFARDMADGRWRTNGEAIKFAGPVFSPTKLLDGQNRLHAVLKSGATVRMLVVFGVDESVQGTMDSGTRRSVADNLTINGVKNATAVASIATLATRVKVGRATGGLGFTNASYEEWIAENPAVVLSAEVAMRYARQADALPSVVGYTHFEFAKIDLGEATAFWRDAAEKVGLAAGDPVIALASRFAQGRRQNEHANQLVHVAAVFRTWNYRRQGKSLTKVQFVQNADGTVTIPRLV